MKVPGLLKNNNYGERFDKLMEWASGIFNTLLSRASEVPRNYIIDQTNVFKSARKRKLKPFAFFQKIAIVVFPKADELKVRAEKRFKEMGKYVPPEAVNKMLANFELPMSKDMQGTDEYFDLVIFTELNRLEAQQQLDEMKRALALSSGKTPSDAEPPVPTFPAYAYPGVPVPSYPAHVYPADPPYPANANAVHTGWYMLHGVQLYQTNLRQKLLSPFFLFQFFVHIHVCKLIGMLLFKFLLNIQLCFE